MQGGFFLYFFLPGIILCLLALMLPAHNRSSFKDRVVSFTAYRRVQLFCSLFNIFSVQSLITALDKIIEFCNTISRSKTGWDVLDFNTSFSAMKLVRMKQAEFGQPYISGTKIKRKRKKTKTRNDAKSYV